MRSRKPEKIPGTWPKWDRQCSGHSRRTNKPCNKVAVIGGDRCGFHGGAGEVSEEAAWRRYVLWLLCPDAVRHGVLSPIAADQIEILADALCRWIVTEGGHEKMSAAARLKAVELLFEMVSIASHPDPAVLLTNITPEEAHAVVKILVDNGLLKIGPEAQGKPQRVKNTVLSTKSPAEWREYREKTLDRMWKSVGGVGECPLWIKDESGVRQLGTLAFLIVDDRDGSEFWASSTGLTSLLAYYLKAVPPT
jgi:hypothetical protein